MPFWQSAEWSLGSPLPIALLRAVPGLCFYCDSSVLYVVMSACIFGTVQFLSVFILTLLCVQFICFCNGGWVDCHLFWGGWEEGLLARLVICNSVVCLDMFVRLFLLCLGWALGSGSASS